MNLNSAIGNATALVRVNSFIRSVYNWMAIGLVLTAATAFYVASTPAMLQLIFGNRGVLFGMIIAELGMVFYLSARVQKMSASTATALFVLYSILNGATLASIFIIYTRASIVSTFLACALTFAACSIYGLRDQTGPDIHGRVHDYGAVWYYHSIGNQHVFQEPRCQHDHLLCGCFCICRSHRL